MDGRNSLTAPILRAPAVLEKRAGKKSPDKIADQPHGCVFPQKALLEASPDVGKIFCFCIDSDHLGAKKEQIVQKFKNTSRVQKYLSGSKIPLGFKNTSRAQKYLSGSKIPLGMVGVLQLPPSSFRC